MYAQHWKGWSNDDPRTNDSVTQTTKRKLWARSCCLLNLCCLSRDENRSWSKIIYNDVPSFGEDYTAVVEVLFLRLWHHCTCIIMKMFVVHVHVQRTGRYRHYYVTSWDSVPRLPTSCCRAWRESDGTLPEMWAKMRDKGEDEMEMYTYILHMYISKFSACWWYECVAIWCVDWHFDVAILHSTVFNAKTGSGRQLNSLISMWHIVCRVQPSVVRL